MERNELMALIANVFKKGASCTVVVNKLGDTSMNKGRGTNTNPFMGRVWIEKTYSGFVMGTDYQRSIENAAERMGNDAKANLKAVWHKPIEGALGEWFSTDKRTESKIYLKLQRSNKQVGFKTTTTYYLDGHVATDEEFAAISMWLKNKDHKQSSTQVEIGLTAENEQYFILPQLETITSIKQDEREIKPCELLEEAYAVAYAE